MDRSAIAQLLGRRGGLARAKRLDQVERRRIASQGARARMESLTIARRIYQNFYYLTASLEHAPTVRVLRMHKSDGPLPKIAGAKRGRR